MRRILITGISGFLGSHIAEALIEYKDIELIGLKRDSTDTWRCQAFSNQIKWIDINQGEEWKENIKQISPDIIIHCAWIGVEAVDRNDWTKQLLNINFLTDLLTVITDINLSKFIFVGSQAEYGSFNGKISEETKAKPLNAYSGTKLACLELLKTYCELNAINWIWIRLFSVFGEKESLSWLIPSLINKMQIANEMDFTLGDQKYAYLYTKDFAEIMAKVTTLPVASGVYNLSAEGSVTLRSIIEQIRDRVKPDFRLNFGALPYRDSQTMHLEGDISKLIQQIGKINFTDFNLALQQTIAYYTSK